MCKYPINLVILFCVILLSCEIERDVNIQEPDPKLVVNCWFTSNGEWLINISSSKFINDTGDFRYLDSVNVEVLENEEYPIGDFISKGNGWYSFKEDTNRYYAIPGCIYTLKVNHKGFKPVEAIEPYFDKPVIQDLELDTINIKYHEGLNNNYGYLFEISIKKIMPGTEHFYQLQLTYNLIIDVQQTINGKKYYPGDTIYNIPVAFYSEESDIYSNTGEKYNSFMFLSDLGSVSESHTIKLILNSYIIETGYQMNITLSSISENYYNYVRDMDLMRRSDIYTNPVYIHSNIQDGYGIFAGLNNTDTIISF